MAIITFTHQPLILTVASEQPTLPSPADLTPDDPGWVPGSNLLIGQFAYNNVDDKWYYRGETVGIQEFQIDPGTNTLFDLFDTDISSPVNGSILRFNTTSGKWEDNDTIDADTIEGTTRQSIIDDSETLIRPYDFHTNMTGKSSSTGWFAIGRWKTLNADFGATFVVQPGGGLNFDYIKIEGSFDEVDETKWNVRILSTDNTYFTKVKLSQETVGGEDFTYLWIYKNIVNTETFSVIAERSEYKFDSDAGYEFQGISLETPLGLSNIRTSAEYDISDNIININNVVKINSSGDIICNSVQTGASGPTTQMLEVPIGTWDMSTTESVDIALPAGVTHEQVVDASIMISNNTGTESSPLNLDGYWFVINTDDISLVRNENGYYDTSDFSGATARGTIFLTVKI